MTWGCNATYQPTKCRYCGGPDVDDQDSGLTTHEQKCPKRPWNWFVRLITRRAS